MPPSASASVILFDETYDIGPHFCKRFRRTVSYPNPIVVPMFISFPTCKRVAFVALCSMGSLNRLFLNIIYFKLIMVINKYNVDSVTNAILLHITDKWLGTENTESLSIIIYHKIMSRSAWVSFHIFFKHYSLT